MKRVIAAVLLIVLVLSLIPSFADTETKTYTFKFNNKKVTADIPITFIVKTNLNSSFSNESYLLTAESKDNGTIIINYIKPKSTDKPYDLDYIINESVNDPNVIYYGIIKNDVYGELVGGYLLEDKMYAYINRYGTCGIAYFDEDNDYSPDKFNMLTSIARSLAYVDNSTSTPFNMPSPTPTPSVSTGMKNALSSAKLYLSIMAFSREGLITQLKFEGYSDVEATYAVDNCGANWNDQAVEKAKQYLELMPMSRSSLITQLVFEGFTQEQAEYGASKAYN